MSFTDNYLALFEEEKKKKKKKTTAKKTTSKKTSKTGHSFTDNYLSLGEQEKEKSVAPLYVNKTAALYQDDDIAPVTGGRSKKKEVAKTILGEDEGLRDASWWEATVKSAQRGYYNSRLGEETFAAMLGNENEAGKYRKILEDDEYQFEADGWLKKAISGGSELIGQMARQFTNEDTLQAGLAGAGTFATGAAILGQAGPQIATPEEVVTVPSAALLGLKTGLAAGSAKANLEIEAGHAYNEMLENGISEETAKNIALGVGSVNAALELIQADELLKAYKVLNKSGVADTALKRIGQELVDRGIDVAKETAQEVAQEGVTIAGVQAASKKDTGEWAYSKEDVASRLGETAASSALSFGAMNVPAAVSNTVSAGVKQTAKNKLTENEQMVVDKEYENRVAKEEKDGKKLTNKEKDKIYDEVLEAMEKGRISTDTIEEVLGGETYQNYQSMLQQEQSLKDSEKSLQEEIETLLDKENPTIRDQERLAEARKSLATVQESLGALDTKAAKETLSGEVQKLTANDKLSESYNDKARVRKGLDIDPTQYDGVARKSIENAIKSGANNTNAVRDFVEFTAKVSADTGLEVDYATDADLEAKRAELGVDRVNETVSGKKIVLNTDSSTALNDLLGHAVTHKLEGTKHYAPLVQAYKQFVGEEAYAAMRQEAADTYKNDKNANPESEVVAKLSGGYLFTDENFVKTLSVEHQNVFQWVFNEIKHLYKMATAGSKEARSLEKIMHLYEKSYREAFEGQKNTAKDSSVKYSIVKTSKMPYGEQLSQIENRKLNGSNSLYVGKPSEQLQTAGLSDAPFAMNQADYRKARRTAAKNKNYSSHSVPYDFFENMPGHLADAPMLIDNSGKVSVITSYGMKDTRGNASYVIAGVWTNQKMDSYTVNQVKSAYPLDDFVERIKGAAESGKLVVTNKNKAEQMLTAIGVQPAEAASIVNLAKSSLSQQEGSVKEQFSLSKDSEKADADYLKAAESGDTETAQRMVDEAAKAAGYTVRAYHGTARSDRVGNVFLPERATSGPMAFFTDDKQIAENYSKSKQDTSMAYDPDFDSYETQFRIKAKDKDMPLYKAWGYLPFDARRRITQKASQLRENWDGDYELILDPDTNEANGGFQWQLKEARGNAIQALTEQWLNSGTLFGEEARFLEVLEMAGVTEEFKKIGMDSLYFKDPDAKYEKVYDTYLKITKPFDTATVDERFISDLESWYEEHDQGQYVRENMESDLWDKNGIDAYEFANRLRSDIENNTTHAWTSIPDSVTDYLKHLGYDGIKDAGGKYSGIGHTVWIPFSSEQVKSAEAVTRDDSGNVIPLSERFNPGEVDIRYSLSKDGQPVPSGNWHVYGKDFKVEKDEIEHVQESAPVVSAENATTTIEHSVSDLADIAKQARRENMRGAYTHNGKQYLSDGSFIAEFNTVDESLEQSEDFPIKQAVKELDEAFARQVEGNYDLHASDTRGFVKVGNSLFGTKRVNALIRALENPVFSIANVHGGHEALIVTADNGRAVLMPVRASGNAYLAYEAQPIADAATFPDDLAPMTDDAGRFESLTDADAPPETEAPIAADAPFRSGKAVDVADPFEDREVPYGNEGKKQKAYMYENPEVKPFFQAEAYALLEELNSGTKGERWYNDRLYYESGGEAGFGGVSRHQSESIDRLSYEFGLSYDDIEKGLNAIIEDNGAENIAAAKKIEFVINDRLMYGYKPFGAMLDPDAGKPNQDYIALMQDKQRVESLADSDAPPIAEDDIAPVPENVSTFEADGGQQAISGVAPTPPVAPVNEQQAERVAQIRKAEPQKESLRGRIKDKWSEFKRRTNDVVSTLGDKGWVFENVSKKTGNREVEAKYDFMKNRVKGQAQEYVKEHLLPIYDRVQEFGEQKANVTPIVEVNGKTVTDYQEQFDYYAYHLHNIDRMSLETESERVRREEIRKQLDGYTEKQIESIASEIITRNTPQDRVKQIYLAQEYIDLGGAKGKNKAVYDSSVTAEVSRKKVAEYEAANPEFKELEQEILEYNKALRDFAVNQGLITRSVADKWARMYPHYVPIRRTDRQGKSVSVPLDSNRTGVNNPFKRAQGGNSDFIPLLDAMAMNTEQIFYAVARNDFGRELMGALETSVAMDAQKSMDAETRKAINAGSLEPGTRVKAHDRENIGTVKAFNSKTGKYRVFFENQHGHSATVELAGKTLSPLYARQTTGKDVDTSELLESTEANDNAVLEPGKNGQPPQFTVFVKGKPVTFDITEEMYKAMKPADGILSETYAVPNAIASGYKKILTEYDPFFALFRNPVKDTKDVLFNSQHAAATYAAAPKTMKQIATKGNYYQEFIRNGGKQTTYYDTKEMSFTDAANKRTNPYTKAAENFEMFWRLSEYIASREAGRSEKVAMLDAARVTTNFGAGGDFTKWLNRNGALFLNPSVQGAMQIGRNVREAYHGGLKGSAILAAKVMAMGLGGMFFNWLLWDDDEEYEELSDYVKQNYFVVWKTEDGKFIRIPKGRMEAVIQNGFEQMRNLITGDGEVDLGTFADLVANNLAPNNPLENNLFSPIKQALTNTAWYGDDIVPTRLQDVPAAEQYDESTDSFSKWLGEKLDISPYKINYVMQQYGGGFADVALPMFTPEAEGDSLLAPIKDEFMSDSTMKNQNVSDFYDKVDELTVNANSIKATDEDVLMSKFMSAKNSELSDLYRQKREIQDSDMSDTKKYEEVRRIQSQINELAKESLNSYEDVTIDGVYAKVGDVQFRWYEPGEDSEAEPGWKKLTDEQLEKQDEVTRGLGIDAAEYWSNKGEYDFAYTYPEKYEFFMDNGISYEDYKNADEDGKRAYTWAAENPEKFVLAKAVAGDVIEYRRYTGELYDIKADKDKNGDSIRGSRKEKVADYINNMDADYGTKIILFKSEYPADDTYNYEIIEYLNGREDISYEEEVMILKELGFEVDSNGNVRW